MDTPRFDPSHSVEFNLARGLVKLEGGGPRLLLPADAIAALIQAADADGRKDFANRLGSEAGRGVALRVEIDEQRPVAALRERDGQIDGGRRLADATLLVRDCQDAGHTNAECGVRNAEWRGRRILASAPLSANGENRVSRETADSPQLARFT